MKAKYNWHKLKLDYYESPIMEVKGFFESLSHTYTSHTKLKTRWWGEDKKIFIKNYKNKAEDELTEKMVEIYQPSVEEISQVYRSVMTIIRAKTIEWNQKIRKDEKWNIIVPDDIKISDVIAVWELIRTERGLPTKYSQSKIDMDIPLKNWEEKEDVIFYKVES